MRDRLRLRADDGSGELRMAFRRASAGDPHCPDDVAVDVEVEQDAFRGAVEEVWFASRGLDAFAADLDRLVHTGRGVARTCNVGVEDAANEFRIELAAGAAGAVQARIRLLKVQYLSAPEFQPLELRVAFELEPAGLARFAEDWARLFRARGDAGGSR